MGALAAAAIGAGARAARWSRGCMRGLAWEGWTRGFRVSHGLAAWGRAGRAAKLPACHSMRSCSKRPKMRARQAEIRACRAGGSQPPWGLVAKATRRLANCSASGDAGGAIHRNIE